jgi:hypothetical protein
MMRRGDFDQKLWLRVELRGHMLSWVGGRKSNSGNVTDGGRVCGPTVQEEKTTAAAVA